MAEGVSEQRERQWEEDTYYRLQGLDNPNSREARAAVGVQEERSNAKITIFPIGDPYDPNKSIPLQVVSYNSVTGELLMNINEFCVSMFKEIDSLSVETWRPAADPGTPGQIVKIVMPGQILCVEYNHAESNIQDRFSLKAASPGSPIFVENTTKRPGISRALLIYINNDNKVLRLFNGSFFMTPASNGSYATMAFTSLFSIPQ